MLFYLIMQLNGPTKERMSAERTLRRLWGLPEHASFAQIKAKAKAWREKEAARFRPQIEAALKAAKESGDDVRMEALRAKILAGR